MPHTGTILGLTGVAMVSWIETRLSFRMAGFLYLALSFTTLSTASSAQMSLALTGVAAVAPNDVWAVGYRNENSGATFSSTLAEHWDGTNWKAVPTPNPIGGCSSFSAVAAVSSNDVWAAGRIYERAGNCGYTNWRPKPGFLEHWDGVAWTIAKSPSPATKTFNGIAAIAENDVWAVGYVYSNVYLNTTPLVEHWDGSQWTVQPCATIQGAQQVYLNAITAVAPNDIWAVGSYSSATVANAPFSEHWDGTTWKVVPVPENGTFLFGAASGGTNDVWATGYVDVAMRWDGSQWISTSVANTGGSLNGVMVLPNDEAWAVGNQFQYPSTLTLIELWNGSTWSVVPSMNPGVSWNNLFAVSGTGLDDVWAVGGYASASGTTNTLIEHWDGSAWTLVPSP